jgi:hypothetical protein
MIIDICKTSIPINRSNNRLLKLPNYIGHNILKPILIFKINLTILLRSLYFNLIAITLYTYNNFTIIEINYITIAS